MATQADIDALNAAIAQGEKIVKQGDKLVEYRSVEELINARNDLQAQLSAQSNPTRSKQTLLYQGGRGFE